VTVQHVQSVARCISMATSLSVLATPDIQQLRDDALILTN